MVRAIHIGMVAWAAVCLAGCQPAEEEKPLWEDVKVRDLAPRRDGKTVGPRVLNTINIDVHIWEIPAEEVGRLEEAWAMLRKEPLRYYSYSAFAANLFSAGFGQVRDWGKVHEVLVSMDGQKASQVSLLLADKQEQDLAIARPARQEVSHITAEGERRTAVVGPGVIALRIKGQRIPGARGVCAVVAYPVFTLGLTSAVPELAERAKAQELEFTGAGFGMRMGVGDVVLLGPSKYISDTTTLPGLVFSNPAGSLFFYAGSRKRPERREAVRLFILVCTRISD